MGMFDTIIVDSSLLPKTKRLYTGDFQTKDLDNYLSVFYLGVDKKLYTEHEYEDKNIKSKIKLERSYHGYLNFYTHEEDEEYSYWVEFKAIFTKGVLETIELVEEKWTQQSEIKAKQNQYQKESQERLKREYGDINKVLNDLKRLIRGNILFYQCERVGSLKNSKEIEEQIINNATKIIQDNWIQA